VLFLQELVAREEDGGADASHLDERGKKAMVVARQFMIC